MIRFDYIKGDKQQYIAKTMEGEEIGRCRFYQDDYVMVIDQLICEEKDADVAEGLCRAAFDRGLENLCAYGQFENIDCPALEKTCFKGFNTGKSFVVTQFFHTCSGCAKK